MHPSYLICIYPCWKPFPDLNNRGIVLIAYFSLKERTFSQFNRSEIVDSVLMEHPQEEPRRKQEPRQLEEWLKDKAISGRGWLGKIESDG